MNREKFEELKKHIESGEFWTPRVGDYVYVHTHLYIDHGEDDVIGGLATVNKVNTSISAGKPCTFIEVDEHPGSSTKLGYLFISGSSRIND